MNGKAIFCSYEVAWVQFRYPWNQAVIPSLSTIAAQLLASPPPPQDKAIKSQEALSVKYTIVVPPLPWASIRQ